MLQRSSEFSLARPTADLIALLETKPTTWLRGFLRLAAHNEAGRTAPYVEQNPWYRLGEPIEIESGVISARLVWYPHLDGNVFTKFHGEFHLLSHESGATLSIIGVTDSGDPERNVAVLDRLPLMITTALDSRSGLGRVIDDAFAHGN